MNSPVIQSIQGEGKENKLLKHTPFLFISFPVSLKNTTLALSAFRPSSSSTLARERLEPQVPRQQDWHLSRFIFIPRDIQVVTPGESLVPKVRSQRPREVEEPWLAGASSMESWLTSSSPETAPTLSTQDIQERKQDGILPRKVVPYVPRPPQSPSPPLTLP